LPPGKQKWFRPEYVFVGLTPCSNASASTNGLNAEPGWRPVEPPSARFTELA
jgi:hypothetical protein